MPHDPTWVTVLTLQVAAEVLRLGGQRISVNRVRLVRGLDQHPYRLGVVTGLGMQPADELCPLRGHLMQSGGLRPRSLRGAASYGVPLRYHRRQQEWRWARVVQAALIGQHIGEWPYGGAVQPGWLGDRTGDPLIIILGGERWGLHAMLSPSCVAVLGLGRVASGSGGWLDGQVSACLSLAGE